MKKATTTLILAALLPLLASLFSSCMANRGFVSTVTRDDIQQIAQFEFLSDFGVIESGNKIYYDDSLSMVANDLFTTALAESNILPVTETIVITDSTVNHKVEQEIDALKDYIGRNVQTKNLPIPVTIDSILCSRNERFGLMVYNFGFVRSTGNYAGQVALGIALGILSMGSIYWVPYKEMIHSGIIIYDAMNHNFAYVATSDWESSPLKAETHQRQVKRLLRKYSN